MESTKGEFSELVDDVKEYIQTNAEIYKLQASEKAADMGALLAINVVLLIVASMAFLFVSIAAAFLIGELLGKTYLGFLIVAGFYVLAGLIVLYARDRGLKESIADSIIRSIYKS
jgi:hypothetical protein